ncbi:sirohydrochlorin chelatase [Primorskyibacter sp. S87]|uniref:sirohydrochlorin chelatase n=1 Tax=Primorskyibacter sp. S87 TaxID=3415126 RepID=UPI003C7EBE21
MTRSALIVAHGQPSEPDPAEQRLAKLAAAVRDLLSGWTVQSATLAAPGSLEAALASLPENILVYPMFMAKGWFVTSVLPKRMSQRPAQVLDPFGLDPRLIDLGEVALRRAASEQGWDLPDVEVVLAAHGSGRSREPARIAADYATALSARLKCPVHPGFVEEPPSIKSAATGVGVKSLCLPFFARSGGHAQEDVPQELTAAQFKGCLLPVLGELPGAPMLIARSLEAAGIGEKADGSLVR